MNLLPMLMVVLSATVQAAPVSEDWQWDRETPVCRLRQQTVSPVNTIEVTRTPGNEETEVTITTERPATVHEGKFRGGVIGLYPGNKALADVTLLNDEKRFDTYAVTQDPAFIQNLASASEIEISHPKFAPIRRPVRSAAAAADALRSCEDRKLREWGTDPIAWRALKSRPIPVKPVRERFSNLDYPSAALAHGIEADAITRLDVGPDGRVTGWSVRGCE